MGRITDLLPSLYYGKENDLTRFTDILDFEIRELEKKVRGITDLINVDKCPDDKLPYLAALTNCPLIGNDPIFWRKQIKNWAYILKLKGTKRSLELVLDSVGAESWEIKTFFRDAVGGYVTKKPEGNPFIDYNGIWRNIRTHYFGIEFHLGKDFIEAQNYDWDVESVRKKLSFWFERGKPYHSELLGMVILPPKFPPDDHICLWDFCLWEHPPIRNYNWGILTPEISIGEYISDFARKFERKYFTVSDTAFWDISTWGNIPVRLIQVSPGHIYGFSCFMDWGDEYTLTPYKPETEKIIVPKLITPTLWDNSTWDGQIYELVEELQEREKLTGSVMLWDNSRWGYTSTRARRSFASIIGRRFSGDFNLAESKTQFAPGTLRIFASYRRPKWGDFSWKNGYTWRDNQKQGKFKSFFISRYYASLEYGEKEKTILPAVLDHVNWDYLKGTIENSRRKFIHIENARNFERVISGLIDWNKNIQPCFSKGSIKAISKAEFPEIKATFRQEKLTGINTALEWTFDERIDVSSIWDEAVWDNQKIYIKGNAPKPKWSNYKTWKKSATWNRTTELCATAIFGTWKEDLN